VEADFDRDYWMTAAEAKDYGLVDEVLLTNPRKDKKAESKLLS
jgi:ATP-dependent Clp protease protease subunit